MADYTLVMDGWLTDASGRGWHQCTAEGGFCLKPAQQMDGLCSTHQYRKEHGLPEKGVYQTRDHGCVVPACHDLDVLAKGLCSMHYRRQARGRPLMTGHEMEKAGLVDSE